MEEFDNKTIMCSVFFLDIVGYSKKSVTGQIALKDRFNAYLSAAIRDVPITDRIILDTGDGAAINFLGDVEDALKAALSLRENLLNEDPKLNHPLLVRMGINLGPVRLVRDINGQPNIVGDGINVAQRVMGFAEAGQILVSRSYFDAVSRLSPQYAELFHYQGSRTDKHVREHEVYAIGYLDDTMANISLAKKSKGILSKAIDSTKTGLRPATFGMRLLHFNLVQGFERATPAKRVFYAVLVLLGLLGILEVTEENLTKQPPSVEAIAPNIAGTSSVKPVVAAAASSSASAPVMKTGGGLVGQEPVKEPSAKQPGMKQEVNAKKNNVVLSPPEPKPVTTEHRANAAFETKPVESTTLDNPADHRENADIPLQNTGVTGISVVCQEGTEVFIDGSRKGKVVGGDTPLIVPVTPGRHLVIVSNPKGMDWKIVKFETGVTVPANPDFCNQ